MILQIFMVYSKQKLFETNGIRKKLQDVRDKEGSKSLKYAQVCLMKGNLKKVSYHDETMTFS